MKEISQTKKILKNKLVEILPMNNVDDETLSPGAVKRKKKNAENHVNA